MADYKWNIGAFQADTNGSDYKWNIGVYQNDTGSVSFIDAEASITGTGSVEGTVDEVIDAIGTITGTGSLTASADSTSVVGVRPILKVYLVAVGNDRVFYEEL
jgi:hypothetical protein